MAKATSFRFSEESAEQLRGLSELLGVSQASVVEMAVKKLRGSQFIPVFDPYPENREVQVLLLNPDEIAKVEVGSKEFTEEERPYVFHLTYGNPITLKGITGKAILSRLRDEGLIPQALSHALGLL